ILLSNKLETDILMRFALTNQISDAIMTVGIKPKSNFILISIGNKKFLNSLYADLSSISVDLFVKKNDSFLKKHFKITKKQLDVVHSKNPLEDILIEKAATLF
ncbi:MAG: KEOPS complex subunit Cgi121, partial [Nitrosopumilus sp.]|nr:KEOPS complex subunit Cgi121 [Nitrosopumilus sp.]